MNIRQERSLFLQKCLSSLCRHYNEYGC